jgi:hypothetical protein
MPKLTPHAAANLSPEERAKANEQRYPTNQLKPKCPGKVRNGDRAGESCGRTAGAGTSHEGVGYCSKHGGNTPAGKKAAARAYGRQLVLDHKERFGGDRDDPLVRNVTAEAALLEEVRRSVAMVRWLEGRISEWQLPRNDAPESNLMEGRPLNLPPLVEETSKGAPGATDVQAWLLLYREERKHAAVVAKMCIDANISKRLVDLAATQGQVISNIVRLVLQDLEITPRQAELVPQVVPLAIARANAAFEKSLVSKDASDLVNDLPVISTVYKVTNLG